MSDILVLFAGAADGWGVGLKRAGHRVVACAESEPLRREALRNHHPSAVIYDDVRSVTRERLLADLGRLPDVVVGSPPCQDISCANNGRARGVDGERSGLYFEFVRIVGEVRPDWYAAENAAELKSRGYDRVHAALAAVGYTCWPQVVGAREAGYFHLRKRSWLAGIDARHTAGEPLGCAGQPWAVVAAPSDSARQQRGSRGATRERVADVEGRVAADPDGCGRAADIPHRRRRQSDTSRGSAADAGGDIQLQPKGAFGAVGRRTGHGAVEHDAHIHSCRCAPSGRRFKSSGEDEAAVPDADRPSGSSRRCGQRRQPDLLRACELGSAGELPSFLARIERAAQACGLGGRSRLADHYRMADGLRPGLARLCISAYGDALVPDIAEAFGWIMPQLFAELGA